MGVEKCGSVLDIGCGDLETSRVFQFKEYTGVDVSRQAIELARAKRPDLKFKVASELEEDERSELVICLDVLLHQENRTQYDTLINDLAKRCTKQLVVTGYGNGGVDGSHMCFYFEPLRDSLAATNQFDRIYKFGEYRGLDLIVAEKHRSPDSGSESSTGKPNDISDAEFESFLAESAYPDEYQELVATSRASFGWFTKHTPRSIEYPWIVAELGYDLADKKIGEFGTGVSPIPLALAHRGATVFTVDNSERRLSLEQLPEKNEWGFIDYSAFTDSIVSYNLGIDSTPIEDESLDAWVSVSVIEHIPTRLRRRIFKTIAKKTKIGGRILITLDLVKGSDDLWNMSDGKVVEDRTKHGTLQTFIQELEAAGFKMESPETIRDPRFERVDLSLLRGERVPRRRWF
ncbi:MAG: class I SAM-dependent methyltransferase [Planctomycetota bacterium]